MSNQSQHVIFRLEEDVYALNIHHIQEIINMKDICETPKSQRPYLKGVINVRGNIIPVISLRERFQGETSPITRTTRIVITEIAEQNIGIIVDEIIKAELLDIEPLPETFSAKLKTFAEGVSYMGETIVPVLKLPAILEMGGNE